MARIVTHRADHLANAASGALALVIVFATLHLLGLVPPGAPTVAATSTGQPATAGRIQAPALRGKETLARDDTLVQVPAGRLGVSFQVPAAQVPAAVNPPALPPARPAAP